jgi:hypothetical protein
MQFVQPKQITSPISGQPVTPKIVTVKNGKQTVTEAHWICPSSGQFIRKGIVKIEDTKES